LSADTVQRERIIVFAKYPHAGFVKTRLIPALGANGAAELHEMFTRATLAIAKEACEGRSCDLDIRFVGGNCDQMRKLFGSEFCFSQQQGNTLGERLAHAVAKAFDEGFARVVVIGTDCPELETSFLTWAFDCLLSNDMVLGPAMDGGYYLIGLRANQPELFREIDWGTDKVLAQTIDIGHRLGCRISQLKVLRDVDEPQDLAACRSAIEDFADDLPETLRQWYHLASAD
jgi:rSAM/selenodomain-associated transferase 1